MSTAQDSGRGMVLDTHPVRLLIKTASGNATFSVEVADEPAVQIGGIAAVSRSSASAIASSWTGTQRPTMNGPDSSMVGTIRPLVTVWRASSASRANQANESDSRSSPGSSESHTAVPSGSSWTDAA